MPLPHPVCAMRQRGGGGARAGGCAARARARAQPGSPSVRAITHTLGSAECRTRQCASHHSHIPHHRPPTTTDNPAIKPILHRPTSGSSPKCQSPLTLSFPANPLVGKAPAPTHTFIRHLPTTLQSVRRHAHFAPSPGPSTESARWHVHFPKEQIRPRRNYRRKPPFLKVSPTQPPSGPPESARHRAHFPPCPAPDTEKCQSPLTPFYPTSLLSGEVCAATRTFPPA